MAPDEISVPRIVKHQTMRSNVPAETRKNCYFRNLCDPFLERVVLDLDRRFSVHDEAVVRLSSILPANAVNANFCKIEPAVNVFFLYTVLGRLESVQKKTRPDRSHLQEITPLDSGLKTRML